MNKFWMTVIAIVAGMVAVSTLSDMFDMAFSALVIYAALHFYLKSVSTIAQVLWVIVGVAGVLSAITNIPALIGLAAVYVLWTIYRNWNNDVTAEAKADKQEEAPFVDLEKK